MSVSRSRFFRVCLALFLMGAAIFVSLCGVLLLVGSFNSHSSIWGKIFLFGLGLVLLGLSPFVFIVGLIKWRLADPAQKEADG